MVYAPDKAEEGTFEKRLSVRPKHVEVVKARHVEGSLRTLINYDPLVPLAPGPLMGSFTRSRWRAFDPRILGTPSSPEAGRNLACN